MSPAQAGIETLGLCLLKIGARVRVSRRRFHAAMGEGRPSGQALAIPWQAAATPCLTDRHPPSIAASR